MKNSKSSRRPKLPATVKEAIAAGWIAVGNDASVSRDRILVLGSEVFEHADFPGLSLRIKFDAVRTYGSTWFEGRVWSKERQEKSAELERRRKRLMPLIREAVQKVYAQDAGTIAVL